MKKCHIKKGQIVKINSLYGDYREKDTILIIDHFPKGDYIYCYKLGDKKQLSSLYLMKPEELDLADTSPPSIEEMRQQLLL